MSRWATTAESRTRNSPVPQTFANLEQENSAYRARLATAENHIGALQAALKECADDLEAELHTKYKDSAGHVHPALQRRYERDAAVILRARSLLD